MYYGLMGTIAEDIVMFAALAFAFAGAGVFLTLAMATRQDLLGFIPDWLERTVTPESKIYKLATCGKCLSGQIAFWWLLTQKTSVSIQYMTIWGRVIRGPYMCFQWRIDYCLGIVCLSGVIAALIMKKL